MSIYAIGDVQGCMPTLKKLLNEIKFDRRTDQIIFLGDIVNRGHHSLEVLRLLYEHQDCMSTVLGNHDVYALALHLGAIKKPKPHTLGDLLAAPDATELFNFLRKQPFIKTLGSNIFVHAGILPYFSIDEARAHATLLSDMLQSPQAPQFLADFFDHVPPDAYSDELKGSDMLRLYLSSMIFIRMCKTPTVMDLSFKGSLKQAPADLMPWFMMRDDQNYQIFFGHWAAIGYLNHKNYFATDAGCAWGGQLCAVRIEDRRVFLVDNCES